MAGGISGKGGNVFLDAAPAPGVEVAELMKWSFNPKSNNPAWASNRTAGFKRRVAGVRDGSGSCEGKWDPNDPLTDHLEDGASVTLNLQLSTTHFFVVPAIVDGIKVDVDLDSGEVIGWSFDWSLNGAWTKPVKLTAFAGPMGATVAGPVGGQAQDANAQQGPQQAQQSAWTPPTPGQSAQSPASTPGPSQSPERQPAQASPALDVNQLAAMIAQSVAQALAQHPAFKQRQGQEPVVAQAA